MLDAHTGTESDNFSIFLFRLAFALPSFSHSFYMIKPVEVRVLYTDKKESQIFLIYKEI
jgi:hypothetical protein